MSAETPQPPLPGMSAQEAASQPPPRRRRPIWPWIAGAVAIVVLAAAIAIPVSVAAAQRAEDERQAAAAEAAEQERLEMFETATQRCGINTLSTVRILDSGESIELDRVTKHDGPSFSNLECMLAHLKAPQSVEVAIGQTRALDGRQSDSWDGFEASWTYHPDDGASLLIEHAR
jgi:type II secretory pathway pseudopilin PulG